MAEQTDEQRERRRKVTERYREANREKIREAEKSRYYADVDRSRAMAADRGRAYRERHPERHAEANRRWYAENSEKAREASKAWKRNNPERATETYRRIHLRNTYGITRQDYFVMLASQGGGCGICGTDNDGREFCVDHCHATGKVRGLLCRRCNLGIGALGDTYERVSAALRYLGRAD